MARVKYGAIITEIRGSVGGSVFQSNKYGFTMKNTPNMVRPNSQATLRARDLFTKSSQHWAEVEPAIRLLFENYASTFPQYAKNNPAAQLSGYIIAVRWWNCFLIGDYGFPGLLTLGTVPFPVLTPSLKVGSPFLRLYLGGSFTTTYIRYICALSPPVKVTQNFPPSTFRIVATLEGADSFAIVNAAYVEYFGRLPVVEESVFLKVTAYSNDNPQVLADEYFKLVVVAI